MQTLRWIFQLSRPRFWFYVIGPVLLAIASTYGGSIVGKTWGSYRYDLLITGLFFTLPANLLIYGLNDLFDYETDKHNDKKKSYEKLLEPKNRTRFLRVFSLVIGLASLPLLFILLTDYGYSVFTHRYELFLSPNWPAIWSLLGFLFFGVFYSVPPIRAKIRPFIDSFFNILYVFPGLVAYGLITNQYPPLSIVVAGTLWCMAMHAFSAVPDIRADQRAGLRTIATELGKNRTLIFCSMCYFFSAGLTYQYIGIMSFIGSTLYLTLMLLGFKSKDPTNLFAIYKAFPYVNVGFGFALFWYIILGA